MDSRRALQATHQIIRLLEYSKNQSDRDLDTLPGIYAVIDSEGKILKGNMGLGAIFGVTQENLLSLSLSKLFGPEHWVLFKSMVDRVARGEVVQQESQFDIKDSKGTVFHYLWSVVLIGQRPPHAPQLFSIIGKDVTKLLSETQARSRMESELNTARLIQDTLFPEPSAAFGVSSVAGFYEVASECGGDWWYHTRVGDKVYLWIGDVTGHGVPAALVTSAARSAVSVIQGSDLGPAKALTILSRAVLDTARGHRVMTAAVVSIDLKTGECLLASAGHESGVLVPSGKDIGIKDLVDMSCTPSPPLGLESEPAYNEAKYTLSRGDRLVFYTDGIYEVQDPEGKIWAKQNFHRTLLPFIKSTTGAIDLAEAIHTSINGWRKGTSLIDDVTAVTFKF